MTPFPMNPFPGLRSFEQHDARFFYGRDETVDQLLERLETIRAVALLGPSGSGKSSLIRAGLIPAVSEGVLGRAARIVVLRPSSDPVGNLGRALEGAGVPAPPERLRASSFGIVQCAAALAASEPLLLIVDQFEEVFASGPSASRRRMPPSSARCSPPQLARTCRFIYS
jgi:hypothetical protein